MHGIVRTSDGTRLRSRRASDWSIVRIFASDWSIVRIFGLVGATGAAFVAGDYALGGPTWARKTRKTKKVKKGVKSCVFQGLKGRLRAEWADGAPGWQARCPGGWKDQGSGWCQPPKYAPARVP
eukprot:97461-Prorocentrum_minimum.AAC.1